LYGLVYHPTPPEKEILVNSYAIINDSAVLDQALGLCRGTPPQGFSAYVSPPNRKKKKS
jgi:hypothetical protein